MSRSQGIRYKIPSKHKVAHLDDDEAYPPRDQRLELKELVGLKLDGFSLLSGSRAVDLRLEDPIRSLDSTMMKNPRNTEDLTCKAINCSNFLLCLLIYINLEGFTSDQSMMTLLMYEHLDRIKWSKRLPSLIGK